jgi:hypothetical protein
MPTIYPSKPREIGAYRRSFYQLARTEVFMAEIVLSRFIFLNAGKTLHWFKKIIIVPIITEATNLSAYSIANAIRHDTRSFFQV